MMIAGVCGSPVNHSLSPTLHKAWIAAAGISADYRLFPLEPDGFATFIAEVRAGGLQGLNVTLPFKEQALACADDASPAAVRAGAANLLVFNGGKIRADNTDGVGMLGAITAQAPGFDPAAGPAVVLGAGGAGRGAVSALLDAGAPEVRLVNRTLSRADAIAEALGGKVRTFGEGRTGEAFAGANVVINATSAGLVGGGFAPPLEATPANCVVMDMTYKPLITPLLEQARRLGRPIVDGLEMLIRQAEPSYEAFFQTPVPPNVDVRALALAKLEPST